ncbi:diguanylate cyclase (GGDEF)-like protein [Xanthomonas sacchari]|uniref:diguanylate cyclase n=1 Tax=unclassified Xanthomonas TaxID=2643310 RepID=UPI00136B54EC|nr:diguanylate cyclase (GGDEF)-like protein [Xanthomonas sp. F10]
MRSRLVWQSLGALLWWGVLVPCAVAQTASAPVCAPAQALPACVEAVRAEDPAAALRMGLPAWEAAADKQGLIPLGLELVDAASAAGQPDTVVSIGSALLTQPLSPQQRLRLLKKLNGDIWRPRDAARIAQLEGEMRRLEKELPDEPKIAELWRMLAASYYLMGAQDDALRVARIALSKVRTHPDLVEYNANQIIFIVSSQQGRMPDAIAAVLEVERVGKALGKPDDAAMLHNATGVFVYAHEWEKAIEYGQRALAAYDAKPRKGLARADVLNNLGSAYEGANELPRAEAIYRQALASARADDKASVIGPLNNLANVLRRQHRPQEALPLLREAAAALENVARGGDHGDNGEAAIVYSNLGVALADLGQREAAATAFERSRQLFAHSDNVPRRLELYPRMIDNLDALGRDHEALVLMREYKAVNDDAVNVESKTRIAELESAVDLARKKSELAALGRTRAAEQAAYAQLQAREQRQRSVLYGLLAALLALAGFFLLKVREGRVRRRINAELARKNDEIQTQHRELEQLTATIRRQSEEDALTGLRNRRYITAWLQAREAAATPERTQEPLLIALLDVDHFKRVNDLHGHEGGDHALMHLGDLLRECARSTDIIARWGGEEFLWICPGGTLADAPRLFRRLRERLQAEPLVRPTGRIALTVSMGVSLFPAHPGGDWPLSLRIADAALYRAKHAGRDRWVGLTLEGVATDLGADVSLEALEVEGRLRQSGGGGDGAVFVEGHGVV